MKKIVILLLVIFVFSVQAGLFSKIKDYFSPKDNLLSSFVQNVRMDYEFRLLKIHLKKYLGKLLADDFNVEGKYNSYLENEMNNFLSSNPFLLKPDDFKFNSYGFTIEPSVDIVMIYSEKEYTPYKFVTECENKILEIPKDYPVILYFAGGRYTPRKILDFQHKASSSEVSKKFADTIFQHSLLKDLLGDSKVFYTLTAFQNNDRALIAIVGLSYDEYFFKSTWIYLENKGDWKVIESGDIINKYFDKVFGQ